MPNLFFLFGILVHGIRLGIRSYFKNQHQFSPSAQMENIFHCEFFIFSMASLVLVLKELNERFYMFNFHIFTSQLLTKHGL